MPNKRGPGGRACVWQARSHQNTQIQAQMPKPVQTGRYGADSTEHSCWKQLAAGGEVRGSVPAGGWSSFSASFNQVATHWQWVATGLGLGKPLIWLGGDLVSQTVAMGSWGWHRVQGHGTMPAVLPHEVPGPWRPPAHFPLVRNSAILFPLKKVINKRIKKPHMFCDSWKRQAKAQPPHLNRSVAILIGEAINKPG